MKPTLFVPLLLTGGGPNGGGLSCGALLGAWILGAGPLAEPIVTGLFACELRPQVSSLQESAGCSAAVLVSCEFVAMR